MRSVITETVKILLNLMNLFLLICVNEPLIILLMITVLFVNIFLKKK